MLNDSDVITSLYSKGLDKTNDYLTNLKLIRAVNVNPMISSIYVYNDKKKYYDDLDKAGMQKLITDAQTQLDAFMAKQK